jgi:phosphatidylglycerol---prolipoprotein diacylglyceryl transferase
MPVLLTIPWFKLEGLTLPGTSIGLQPFGLLVATGVLLGLKLALRHARRVGIRPELLQELVSYVLVSGFVLGHVFALVAYFPDKLVREPWRIFFIWEDLSSYGGVFGSAVGGFYWSYKRKIPLLPIYECIAYAFPLSWAFGRAGCFVVHDHPGRATDFFLGVANYQYPGLPVATRHDLGLYEVFWSIAVCVLFLWLGRKPRPWGLYTGLFALLYGPFRFGLDFLRTADQTYGGLTPGHYASFVSVAIGVALLLYMKKHGHDPLPPSARLSMDDVTATESSARRATSAG